MCSREIGNARQPIKSKYMAKSIKVCGRLDRIIRKGVSYYGNPHYWIVVVTTEGEVIYGKTCVNGAIGYGLTNGGVGENAIIKEWTYHETRTGNIIFDFVSDIK